nr:immunoglobulin heavy chain junction region [Macaca mulatta]
CARGPFSSSYDYW